jgi:hypothetical protein
MARLAGSFLSEPTAFATPLVGVGAAAIFLPFENGAEKMTATK